MPWHPELGFGAIGEGDVAVLDPEVVSMAGIGPAEMEDVIRWERAELARRVDLYRGDRPPIPVQGRTVIVVDDGIATGGTVRAAIDVVRRRGAGHIVLAVPVAPPSTVQALRPLADEIVVLRSKEPFLAVGQFYEAFEQVTDEEVTRLLSQPAGEVTSDRSGDHPVRTCDIALGSVHLVGDLAMPDGAR